MLNKRMTDEQYASYFKPASQEVEESAQRIIWAAVFAVLAFTVLGVFGLLTM